MENRITDEALAHAIAEAERLQHSHVLIDVDDDTEGDGLGPVPSVHQSSSLVVAPTASRAHPPATSLVFISVPGQRYGRRRMVTNAVISKLKRQKLVEQDETADGAILYTFRNGIPIDVAERALSEASDTACAKAIRQAIARPAVGVGAPPAKNTKGERCEAANDGASGDEDGEDIN